MLASYNLDGLSDPNPIEERAGAEGIRVSITRCAGLADDVAGLAENRFAIAYGLANRKKADELVTGIVIRLVFNEPFTVCQSMLVELGVC